MSRNIRNYSTIDSPIKQVIKQMDEEGRLVFQGTIMAGYSPRQALYNAFGLSSIGDELDVQPDINHCFSYPGFKDERLNKLFMTSSNKDIENTFWEIVENEKS